MNLGVWLRGLLSVIAVIGLVSGPVAAQVTCTTIAADSDLAMSEMADDMPCCADEKRDIPERQMSCQSMATCMVKCFSAAPVLSSLSYIFWDNDDTLRSGSDAMVDAHAVEPQGRPPRA